jgi:hypothetical protein
MAADAAGRDGVAGVERADARAQRLEQRLGDGRILGATVPKRRVDGSDAVGLSVAVPRWRMGVFPFGRPVVACEPVATGRTAMFVLGAYLRSIDR